MIRAPERAALDVLANTKYVNVFGPAPDDALVMEIQLALLVAIHEALEGEVEIDTLPLPPKAGKLAAAGFSEKTAPAPAWVTVDASPATLMEPILEAVALFSATE
jgi:hypothetical protein